MSKRVLCIALIILLLLPFGSVYAINYNDVRNAFWLFKWELVDELIRVDSNTGTIGTIECGIQVDEDVTLRNIDGKYLGVHMTVGDYYDLDNDCLKEKYINVVDQIYDVPLFRMGSSASLIMGIQQPENRGVSYILTDIDYEEYEYDVDYTKSGIDMTTEPQIPEKILVALKNNPNAEFTFTVDIARSYPKDTVNFLHFCTDENGSSEWADLRASWGIPNPIKVHGLEMDNEMYFMDDDYWTDDQQMENAVNWYIKTCKRHAEAIKDDFPDIKVIPCVDGTPDRSNDRFYKWNVPVVTELADYIDMVALHKYYTMAGSYTKVNPSFNEIFDIIKSTGKDIKIALTEHSTWDVADSYGTKLPVKRQTLAAMLDVMKFMCAILPRDEFYCANYHNFMDQVGWGMIRYGTGTKGGAVVSSIGKAFTMLADNLGDRVVKHTVVSDSLYTDVSSYYNELTCVVMGDGDDTLKVMLVNDSPYHRFDIDFSFNKNYKLVSKNILTAPNEHSFIYGKEASDLFEKQTVNYMSGETFNQYVMPTKSMVILTLKAE